jgi:hypothetical protein
MVVEREDHRVILNENCGNSERRSTVVKNRIDALENFRKQLEGADVDLLREMVKIFAEQLMGADADALCGADYAISVPMQPGHFVSFPGGWDPDGTPLRVTTPSTPGPRPCRRRPSGHEQPSSNGALSEKLGMPGVPGKLDSESFVEITSSRSSSRCRRLSPCRRGGSA